MTVKGLFQDCAVTLQEIVSALERYAYNMTSQAGQDLGPDNLTVQYEMACADSINAVTRLIKIESAMEGYYQSVSEHEGDTGD